jgi:hypothetical protein
MPPDGTFLIAAGAALLWAPPFAITPVWAALGTAPAVAGGPDLLTAVLSIGLAAVAGVTVVGGLLLRASRRSEDERKRATEAEAIDRRAISRVHLRVSDDPIVAGMGLHERPRPRGRKR